MLNNDSKSVFDVPSVLSYSTIKSGVADFASLIFGPIFKTLGLSEGCKHYVASSVSTLFGAWYESAIARRVVTVIILAINLKSIFVAVQQCPLFKTQVVHNPCGMHRYASTSVPLVGWPVFVAASLNHIAPYRPEWPMRLWVRIKTHLMVYVTLKLAILVSAVISFVSYLASTIEASFLLLHSHLLLVTAPTDVLKGNRRRSITAFGTGYKAVPIPLRSIA